MWSTSRNTSKTSGRSRPWVSEITPRRMVLLRQLAEGGEDLGGREGAVAEALHVSAREPAGGARRDRLFLVERLMEERHDRIAGGVKDRERHPGVAGRLEALEGGTRVGIRGDALDPIVQRLVGVGSQVHPVRIVIRLTTQSGLGVG